MKQLTAHYLAEETIKRHGKKIRYSVEEEQFYVFDGIKWVPEEMCIHRVEYYIINVISHTDPYTELSISTLLRDTKDILTEYDGIKMNYYDWNKNQDLLCCGNTVVDLKTNNISLHSHKYMQTLCTNTFIQEPELDADGNPLLPDEFYFFLDKMLDNGDFDETRSRIYAFLNLLSISLFGYPEKSFFLHICGERLSGKSQLAQLIGYIIGEYAITMNHELLTAEKYPYGCEPSADIIRTFGKRIGLIDEVCAQTKLSSAFLKNITGGGDLVVRNLYEKDVKSSPSSLTPILFSDDYLVYDDLDSELLDRMIMIKVVNNITDFSRKSNYVDELKGFAPAILGVLTYLASQIFSSNTDLATQIKNNASFFLEDKKDYIDKNGGNVCVNEAG